jgi:hypothetical protein
LAVKEKYDSKGYNSERTQFGTKVKVKVALDLAMNFQRGIRGIVLMFY